LIRLRETVSAVKAVPELGASQFRISNRWVAGGENQSEVQTFAAGGQEIPHRTDFILYADEPDLLLGGDTGANPVEHLLHALASCVTTSMVYHAAARGIVVEAVQSTLEGELDLRGFLGLAPEVRKGYRQIRMKLKIKASDLNEEQLQELAALGPNFSPVYDSLSAGVPLTVTAERL